MPFLDHRLVELTAVVPDRLRPRLLWNKRILRDAVGTRLPDRIAERPRAPSSTDREPVTPTACSQTS
ncbi:asparagine synthase-related protein [Streptomyces sp. AS58]|uniref:asparagine synthase-related protein n=1 Tax=Streptomyces sp. AS58 TaxID=1519489 RepID=UPI003B63A9E2